MSLTVGRLTIADTDKYDWADGNTVTISGEITGSTLAELKARRQQFLGLINDEFEPVKPFTWSEDSQADGFVTVESLSMATLPISLDALWLPFSMTLKRVDHWQQPTIELKPYGANRGYTPGGVVTDPWTALPSNYASAHVGLGANYSTRTGPGGSVRYFTNASLSGSLVHYSIAPANYYNMAATIKFDDYPIIGRQAPAITHLTDWEISNGLIKITPGTDSDDMFKISFPDPAATSNWASTTYDFQVGPRDALAVYPYKPVFARVVRNDSAEVALQFDVQHAVTTTTTQYVFSYTIRLRRGAHYAEIVCEGETNGGHHLETDAAVTQSAYASSSGWYATSNDASGNRLLVFSNQASTNASSGQCYTNSVNLAAAHFGVGFELNGTSSVSPNGYSDVRDQYFAGIYEAQRVTAS